MTEDLGAVLSRLLAVVTDHEGPILTAHGLSMWEYVILARLAPDVELSQKELAVLSRRDPTRLIGNLDALESRGLVAREVDQADRRRRSVRLTDQGRGTVTEVRAAIRRMEADLLAALSPEQQRSFRAALSTVAGPGAPQTPPAVGNVDRIVT